MRGAGQPPAMPHPASPAGGGVEAELVRLASADRTALARRWRMLFGKPAPDMPRAFLHRIIAYRVQADAVGDLDPACAKLLGQFCRGEIDEIPLPCFSRGLSYRPAISARSAISCV